MKPSVYVVGSWTRPEFAEAREWLQANTTAICFSNLPTVTQAIATSEKDPDQILLVQSRPGQFDTQEITRFRRVAPLTRISLLTGSWCEGETRSGFPLANVPRISWLTLKSHLSDLPNTNHSMDNRNSRLRLATGLPPTTPDQDRWRNELKQWNRVCSRRIAVYSADPAQSAGLCHALEARGHQAIDLQPDFQPNAIGFDALLWDDAGGRRIQRMSLNQVVERYRLPDAMQRIALRTFPRIQTVDADRRLGFAATLAKPFQVTDLLMRLELCMSGKARKTTAA